MAGAHEAAGPALPLLLETRDGPLRAAFAQVGAGEYAAVEHSRRIWLHPTELRYLDTLSAERRRRSYLLGRCAAKRALGCLLPQAPAAQLEVANGVFGQPVLRYATSEPLDLSISHTDQLGCALAFPALHPMGLDVEQVSVERAHVMQSQMVAEELAAAEAAVGSAPAACALLWTAKEALSKALRCGMTCPFELMAVAGIEGEPPALGGRFRNFGQYQFQTWIGAGTVLSLVLPRSSRLLTDLSSAAAGMPA